MLKWLRAFRKSSKTLERSIIRLHDGIPVVGFTNGVYYVAFLYEDKKIIVAEFADDDVEDCRRRAHWLYDTLRRAQGRF